MPIIGDITKGREIGKGHGKFIYHACVDCARGHWTQFVGGKPLHPRCNSCGSKRPPPVCLGAIENPMLGDIRRARELGYKGTLLYIWDRCIDCGKERWTPSAKGKAIYTLCVKCANKARGRVYRGDRAPRWINGKSRTKQGYIVIKLQPDDFFFPMANVAGYVAEHRLIMAQHLGRLLQPWEIVHHKDGIKSHNENTNLVMSTRASHVIEHNKGYRNGYQQGYYDGKSIRVKELLERIKLLEKGKQEGK